MKKQYTKQKAALAARIMKRAVEISETTQHEVFCDYSPHVSWLDVQIYVGGWRRDKEHDGDFRIDFDHPESWDEDVAGIMAALDELQKGAK